MEVVDYEKLKRIIIASYDWDNESSFGERLEENLKDDKELRDWFYENIMDISK